MTFFYKDGRKKQSDELEREDRLAKVIVMSASGHKLPSIMSSIGLKSRYSFWLFVKTHLGKRGGWVKEYLKSGYSPEKIRING